MSGEKTWTHAFNTKLHWQGMYQWDMRTGTLCVPAHTHRPVSHHPHVRLIWKTALLMSVQLRNISALLGDVMIHLWGCQRRRGEPWDRRGGRDTDWYWAKREWGEQIEGSKTVWSQLLSSLRWASVSSGYTDRSLWYVSALLVPQRALCTARHLCSVRN